MTIKADSLPVLTDDDDEESKKEREGREEGKGWRKRWWLLHIVPV